MLKIKKILFISLILVILLTLSGCDDNKKGEQKQDLIEKVVEEMRYLDTRVIDILNGLNNITLENYVVSSKEITTTIDSSQSSGEENEGKSQTSTSNSQGSSSSSSSTENSSKDEKITVSEMKEEAILLADFEDIDWDNIKNQIELINSFWSIITIDLYSLNVNKEDVIGFNNSLDKTIISIKEENKENSLSNLAEMYGYIPKYLESIKADNSIQKIYKTKNDIINAYTAVGKEEWDNATTSIENAKDSFNNIMQDLEYVNKNKYKVDKAFILINDLKNSLINEDKEMFYMKYKNVIQALNVL